MRGRSIDLVSHLPHSAKYTWILGFCHACESLGDLNFPTRVWKQPCLQSPQTYASFPLFKRVDAVIAYETGQEACATGLEVYNGHFLPPTLFQSSLVCQSFRKQFIESCSLQLSSPSLLSPNSSRVKLSPRLQTLPSVLLRVLLNSVLLPMRNVFA